MNMDIQGSKNSIALNRDQMNHSDPDSKEPTCLHLSTGIWNFTVIWLVKSLNVIYHPA